MSEHSLSKLLEAKVKTGQGPCTHPTGIAISVEIADKLEIEVGDPVIVKGKRDTIAVVESIEPLTGYAVYLGRILARNANAAKIVKLQHAPKVSIADKVVLAIDRGSEANTEELRKFLKGLFLGIGDHVEVPGKGLLQGNAVVTEIQPKPWVQFGDASELITKKATSSPEWTVHSSSLGGFEAVLGKLKDLELRLINQVLLESFGSGPIKGVVVAGPSGVGKTLLFRSLLNESEVNCILVTASELAGLDHGEAERRIKEVFSEAKQHCPSIILIDDLDSICPRRSDYSQPEEKRVLNVMLGMLDDLTSEHSVMVVGAVRDLELLDPALRRSGRFDKEIELSLPNLEERKEILEIYSSNFPLEDNMNLEQMAEAMHGFTGADIELLCKDTIWAAVKREIGIKNLDKASKRNTNIMQSINLKNFTVKETDFFNSIKETNPSMGRTIIVDIPVVKWEDVGGYENVKLQLEKDVIAVWSNRATAKELGIEIPRGILLFGPAGTGKTHLAKGLANKIGSKVIVVRSSTLLSKWLGEYEQNIAGLFDIARKAAPVIVIMDEVDTIAAKRGAGIGESTRALDSGLNVLLQELDGVQESGDAFVICITNRIDMLDDAFMRSGRIGRKIYIGKPDERTRQEIFNIHLNQVKAKLEGIDSDELARLTPSFTGADIKETVRNACSEAFYEFATSADPRDFTVYKKHFISALKTMGVKNRNKK